MKNEGVFTSGASRQTNVCMTDSELKIVRFRLQKVIQEELMSLVILKRADKKRYANLQESLANSFLIGRDEYPTTIGAVLKLLNNYVLSRCSWVCTYSPNSALICLLKSILIPVMSSRGSIS